MVRWPFNFGKSKQKPTELEQPCATNGICIKARRNSAVNVSTHLLREKKQKADCENKCRRAGKKCKREKKKSLVIANGLTVVQALGPNVASGMPVEEFVTRMRTDAENGLSKAEATRRLEFSGYNEFELKKKVSVVGKYFQQFKNPLICLLLASAIVSVLMKQFDDALSITVAVFIVVTVGFVQEYRSEKTLEKLNKLVPPMVHCIRDGKSVCFLARELVPGDVVLLSTGDRVPADMRIIESIQLQIDESSFTGENEARFKHSNAIPENAISTDSEKRPDGDESIDQLDNIAFMGTLVCQGRGKGVVIGTGTNSMFGEVFKMMQSEESPKTPLQKSMDQLGKQLSICSFVVIGIIFAIGLIQGRPVQEMFNIGVSLAVAAIPEGLPIVVAVTLAIGVIRMGRRNAVVKKMSAVETLGCVTVICTDKTGTLTKNEMTACKIVPANGLEAEVTGIGYDAAGGECHLTNGEVVKGHSHPAISRVVEIGAVCNNAQLAHTTVIGQPTEGALLVLAIKTQLDTAPMHFRRLNEIAFSSDNKWMAVEVEPRDKPGERQMMLKGAIGRVLSKCIGYFDDEGEDQPKLRPFTADECRERILQMAHGLGQTGLRVIGMASGADMNSLYYAGLVGLLDPPRTGCRESIETVQSAGVSVKMITGDSLDTATSIGTRLHIFKPGDANLSGVQIDELSDEKLERLIQNVTIFYRASPRHKLRIVKALQNIGEVVAMTGDGVNDAVALKRSDIGVAMGQSGTDVCKEASDMVLINDDFSTIRAAIEEGKGIYHNITNFVKFQLSTSVAALALVAISTIFGLENPLNAIQILWINIIMDGPPAQSLGVEPVDTDIIRQPPRNVREPLINKQLMFSIASTAIIIIGGTFSVFYNEMDADYNVNARNMTMTFTCFVFFSMWNALSCRSSRKMIWEIGLFRNRVFCVTLFVSLVCQMLVIYVPPLQHIFQTEALGIYDLIFLALFTSSVFIFNETGKFIRLRWERRKNKKKRVHNTGLLSLV